MKIIGIIPARGGSKGLPGKNIRMLSGKPLISYAISVGLASQFIDNIVVTTDDDKIASISKEYGANVIIRPPEISKDHSLVIDAMKQVLEVEKSNGNQYDYAVLLEPTSPLRTTDDIDQIIQLIINKNADSAATFSETPTPPNRIWRIERAEPKPFIKNANPFLPRQSHETGYFLNGMVYVVKTSILMKQKGASILSGQTVAHIIPSSRVVDIDNLDDFRFAEYLMLINS